MVASVAAIRAGGASASVAYYVDQVAADRHDYYAGHGEAPGVWRGAFADQLALSGEVTAEAFRAILEGRDPTSDAPLKPRANRRVAAWDVTFSPPKSISALWALAHEDARRTSAKRRRPRRMPLSATSPATPASHGSAETASTARTARNSGSCGRSSRTGAPAKATRSCTPTLRHEAHCRIPRAAGRDWR